MEKINNLLIILQQQWLVDKKMDINILLNVNDEIRLLNRKEKKPLKVNLSFYKLKRLQTITGLCSYLNLLIGNRINNSYLTAEIKTWKKISRKSCGKTIKQKIYYLKKVKIPIYNLISIQAETIPNLLKKYI